MLFIVELATLLPVPPPLPKPLYISLCWFQGEVQMTSQGISYQLGTKTEAMWDPLLRNIHLLKGSSDLEGCHDLGFNFIHN